MEPLPGTWCGAMSARGCRWPSNTPSMVPAPPQVEYRAVGRWLSIHSNGRGLKGTRKWLISITLVLFLLRNNRPEKSTAAAIPSLPLETDSDSSPFSHAATIKLFPPIPASTLLVLQELLTLDVSCSTGVVTLRYCTGEGGSTNVASALLALACTPGITLVARRDDPLLLRGTRDDDSSSGLLFCSGLSRVFPERRGMRTS